MSQPSTHPSCLQVLDRLDELGQRLRVVRLARGAVLLATTLLAVTPLAGLIAHFGGPGAWSYAALSLWLATLACAGFAWFVKPMLVRPRAAQVARLVETRVPNLHNGLTNVVLLARADDLQASPFLGSIFDEVLHRAEQAPLDDAIRFAELRPLLVRGALVMAAVLLLGLLFHGPIAHGWRQMIAPEAFVPKTGIATILEVKPGNATLVAGQPLEITLLARDVPLGEPARLLLKPGDPEAPERSIELATLARDAQTGETRFAHRIDHVDAPLTYRLEVAGTQSERFEVRIVREVKLTRVTVRAEPPAYARPRASTTVHELTAEQIGRTSLAFPQGSKIDLGFEVDLASPGALLQLPGATPLPTRREQEGLRFVATIELAADTAATLLLTDGCGQVVAQLPEPPLALRAILDVPPSLDVRFPSTDAVVAPDAKITLDAVARDDHGLTRLAVLLATETDQPLAEVYALPVTALAEQRLQYELALPDTVRKHGRSVRVQLLATDNRALGSALGPQTTRSTIYEIRFRDPQQLAAEQKASFDQLRALLQKLLDQQRQTQEATRSLAQLDAASLKPIEMAQQRLHDEMLSIADTFAFDGTNRTVQKTLLVLARSPAAEAVELAKLIPDEPVEPQRGKLHADLQSKQRRIIETLETLLALLARAEVPTTQPGKEGGDLVNEPDPFQKLLEALKQYEAEQRRILDQTANLAKKPVDDWTSEDRALLDQLRMAQEKLDAFLEQAISDFAKNPEQDFSNPSLMKELLEVYSEVTMAKDALNKQPVEIAVALEESGLELAEEITSNLEKWLMDEPDRTKWNMEDPVGKTDTPMAELPGELEDMIGELMEQQEDLFEEMEDTNANWADSLDKGAGWDAMDGPIANMTAKGVTGNALPNDNEMGGRAGEGRSGKSQGEMVEDTATGKGGRNTPTRLDPTPFQKGEINDQSKDPVGGATGGGKLSGQGGEGLEGPVPPALKREMERLAQKQAQLRNTAERLQAQFQLSRYDNFKLLQAVAMMRRVESDLQSNRYNNAMRRRDVLLDDLGTSHLLLSGEVHVQRDTTPSVNPKLEDEIGDAMKGALPAGWDQALREYYRKLAAD